MQTVIHAMTAKRAFGIPTPLSTHAPVRKAMPGNYPVLRHASHVSYRFHSQDLVLKRYELIRRH